MFENSTKYTADRLGSTRTKNRKNLDRLTKDVLAAQMAGMSYGKYKALHPSSGESGNDLKLGAGKTTFTCVNCGKVVITRGGARRKYCCEQCRYEYNKKREQERRAKEKEGRENGKE